MPQAPTLLVCSGGGLQGAFLAGAATRLEELFPQQMAHLNHLFATSSSIGGFFYYFSFGSQHGGKKMWTHNIPNSGFLTFTSAKSLFSSQPVYDINHLVEVVFKRNNPLNIPKIKATPIHFLFPILNVTTHEVELFSNRPDQARLFFPHHTIRNWLEYDVYDLIHAACALPILYDRPVKLGSYEYCDAGLSEPFLVPDKVPPHLRALYLVVRTQPQWKNDFVLILIALLWRLRGAFGKTGLPAWVYTHIAYKPFSFSSLMRRLRKTIPNLTLISASTPLMSSLQNTPESALHNWRTGESHITARQQEIQSNFWGQ